ncbi:MAG: hypothetical protein BECKG1743F_GA0114225_111021, partial [Candidatus Kentron sp. G]
ATMSAIRHPCLIMGQCPSNFEGRNTLKSANHCLWGSCYVAMGEIRARRTGYTPAVSHKGYPNLGAAVLVKEYTNLLVFIV